MQNREAREKRSFNNAKVVNNLIFIIIIIIARGAALGRSNGRGKNDSMMQTVFNYYRCFFWRIIMSNDNFLELKKTWGNEWRIINWKTFASDCRKRV